MIANYAAFVRKELADGSRAAGDVDQIITASRRASELTRRLLLFSRRQSGTPEVLSLRRVIEGVELLLQRTLGDEHRPHACSATTGCGTSRPTAASSSRC